MLSIDSVSGLGAGGVIVWMVNCSRIDVDRGFQQVFTEGFGGQWLAGLAQLSG
ncbi:MULTISPECIES: hypothetical protein [unclassified Pseudomonas]|jgi:hypothetical protein|uniref:hypothetical protein n=1 Tax=unclassified Pseudomonas TaxID=196821 RepID=UPI002115A988|nr:MULTISPECIES: hypothetical protein [unclassified Pseudomonas]